MSNLKYAIKVLTIRPVLLITLIALSIQACNNEENSDTFSLQSDLEIVSGESFETSESTMLSAGQFQSSEMARSGTHSVKLNSKSNSGLEGTIENIQIGDEIHIKVWRAGADKEKGTLHLFAGYLYAFQTNEVVKTEGDWELLELKFVLPFEFPGKGLRWFVSYEGVDNIFFDDLYVSLKRNNGLQIKSHEKLPRVNLEIDQDGVNKIDFKREKALSEGVLISSSDDWVRGRIQWNDEDRKAKVRLKGDWTDHLYGKKYSLRANVSKGKTLGSYSKFGIQKPEARHYLDEWFTHKILIDEGILTTRFEFVDFYINDQNMGLYAIEEHFTSELLTSQDRKEGNILKFSEDELWASRHKNNNSDIRGVPWYEASKIEAFSFKNILEDEQKLKDFFLARDLMYQYQFKLAEASSFIDVKQMAGYLALMDLCGGYHSIIWHNQRFYYNNETKLLEPLVYDIFQENSRIYKSPVAFLGLHYVRGPKTYEVITIDFLFQDSSFVSHYTNYLEKFSDPSFFTEAQSKYKSDIALFETEIHKEYDFYSFDLSLYEERAKAIREGMEEFKTQIQVRLDQKLKPAIYKLNIPNDYYPIENVSLKANISFESGQTELQLWNFYYQDLEIIGLIINDEEVSFENTKPLPAYLKTAPPKTTSLTLDHFPEAVMYKVAGEDSSYTQKVTKYRLPEYKSHEK